MTVEVNEKTQAEVVKEVSKEADEQPSVELPDERERKFKTPGFSRTRTDWQGDDAVMMTSIRLIIDEQIARNFRDAYALMHEVYELVRTPDIDAQGEVQTDHYGWPIWRRTASGAFEEDWSRLTHKERERFMYQITTRLFAWEQAAADAWGESMFAKALWEDRFSIGYESSPPKTKDTIEGRTARGRLESREERYFAIFKSYYSRRADAIVRTMTLLGQRLKDTTAS